VPVGEALFTLSKRHVVCTTGTEICKAYSAYAHC